MTNPYRTLLAEMAADLDWRQQLLMNNRKATHPLADRARVLLDQRPEPEGLTDEELQQMLFDNHRGAIEFLCDAEEEAHLMIRNHVKFAQAAIAADRARRPTPQPPAASEVAQLTALVALLRDEIAANRRWDEVHDRAQQGIVPLLLQHRQPVAQPAAEGPTDEVTNG